MRHRKGNNNLKRKSSHRKAMLANMSCSLIVHKRIKTTLAKAKVLKQFIEPIITRSKIDSTHNRRVSFRYLRQKDAIKELFSIVSDKIGDRPGGYTRIIKLGNRMGDAAEMCFIELVDFNEVYNVNETKSKKTRRSRRSDKSNKNKLDASMETGASNTNDSVSDKPISEAPASEAPASEAPASEAPASEAPTNDNKKTEESDK